MALAAAACSCVAATDGSGGEPEQVTPSYEDLKGCKGKASSAIPSSGVYVLTTFGGPSEPQPLACGGHSKSGSWYYAASKQRYGCGSRVRITANGKCVVAQTDDYGPDACVEKATGFPVMDVSPLVSKHLYGTSSLGWSDRKKVIVLETDPDEPLGPCKLDDETPSGGGGGGSSGAGGGGAGGTSGAGASAGAGAAGSGSTGGGSGGGTECTSHGECNPGNDGSGLICVGGTCVPGCKSNAHCPGVTTCKNGQCS